MEKQYNNFDQTFSSNINQTQIGTTKLFSKIDFSLQNKKVLDVGCGDGNDCINLKKMGASQVSGVDPSENFINSAKTKLPEGDFVVGSAEALPYEDNSFEVIISKYAIQTSTDVPKCLNEMARVIKENGILVYLAGHPLRQFLEKKKNNKDYFKQEIVDSIILDGKIIVQEPTHTLKEYLNKDFLKNFEILDFEESYDFPASEQINGDIYPTFFVIKAKRKQKS